MCLTKLFRFSFIDRRGSIGIVKSYNEINLLLKQHGLFSYHHRLLYRLLIFIHNILHSNKSPIQLKQWLQPNLVSNRLNLRNRNSKIFKLDRNFTKFGDITFKNFCGRLLNHLNFNEFCADFTIFKKNILSMDSFNSNLSIFIKTFNKFEVDLNFYFLFI